MSVTGREHGQEPERELGSRIRQMREARGWSLAVLHRETGISKTYLVRIENHQTNLSLDTIRKLAGALGVDPAWLAFGPPHVRRRAGG